MKPPAPVTKIRGYVGVLICSSLRLCKLKPRRGPEAIAAHSFQALGALYRLNTSSATGPADETAEVRWRCRRVGERSPLRPAAWPQPPGSPRRGPVPDPGLSP